MNREPRKITRSRGGTEERVVFVKDLLIPDIPDLSETDIPEYWVKSAHQLHEVVKHLIRELSSGCDPSTDLFIPNYWKAVVDLSDTHSSPLLELWNLAHDIGKEAMSSDLENFTETQDGVSGHMYLSRRKNA